jgi:hypothetical protein
MTGNEKQDEKKQDGEKKKTESVDFLEKGGKEFDKPAGANPYLPKKETSEDS